MEKANDSTNDELDSAQLKSSTISSRDKNDTLICQVMVKVPGEKNEEWVLMRPRDVPDLSDSIRKSWVDGISQFIESGVVDHDTRPLNFHLSLDGSVEGLPLPDEVTSNPSSSLYPAPYRVPPESVASFKHDDKVRTTEHFAVGSLIYEIYANKAPFEDLEDSEIQACYRHGYFPVVTNLPQWPTILSCWSSGFAYELWRILSKQ